MKARVQVAAAGLALSVVYWESLLAYVQDQHYQEHFVYLWVFLVLALSRSLRGPFRGRFGFGDTRDRIGIAGCLFASLLFAVSAVAGSTTGMRTSLVLCVCGLAVLAVPRWTVKRCLMHGLLLLLCFGIPYSVYFPLTSHLQWGVATVMSLPARLGLADYSVDANVVQFPHYQLVITADCSGLGQLLTFAGIAALGVLSSAPNRRRTATAFALAVGLAWLSNLARVGLFVFLVGIGWTDAVDSEFWHATLGFLVFLPFVTILVAFLLKGHAALPAQDPPPVAAGWFAIGWLLLPLVVVRIGLWRGPEAEVPEPPYFAALAAPPDHRLDVRGPEEHDRAVYATPWLVNARFADDHGRSFDLLHYTTRSRSHLCVHKIAACLHVPGQQVRYEPPVTIDGKLWWRVALDREDPSTSQHVYFAFEVGGVRRDDSVATQWEVFRQRLFGGSWEVRLTRVVLQGELPPAPDPYANGVLTWLGRTTAP